MERADRPDHRPLAALRQALPRDRRRVPAPGNAAGVHRRPAGAPPPERPPALELCPRRARRVDRAAPVAPGGRGGGGGAAAHTPAYYIKVSAQADGTFTVTNMRNGFSKTYPKRS